jgi:hypothetical protein
MGINTQILNALKYVTYPQSSPSHFQEYNTWVISFVQMNGAEKISVSILLPYHKLLINIYKNRSLNNDLNLNATDLKFN